jgi:hypothetical protein
MGAPDAGLKASAPATPARTDRPRERRGIPVLFSRLAVAVLAALIVALVAVLLLSK